MSISRKDFFRLAGIGLISTSIKLPTHAAVEVAPKKTSLTLGMASYTLRNFGIADVIDTCKRLDLKKIALKSFHLPYEADAATLKTIVDRFKAEGLDVYGAGVIYMKTEKEVHDMFNYAKNAGIGMIIGVPNHELLPLVDKVVMETGVKLAIHNHGPEDSVYPSVHVVADKIKNLNRNIGFCIDTGHVFRNLENPAAMINQYKDRLFDIHIKDIDKAIREGKPQEIGRGNMDIPAIVKALKKVGYKGSVSFEYEKDGNDPFLGLAESVGYIRALDAVL